MKTKKAILKWWQRSRGEDLNDLKDFAIQIDKAIRQDWKVIDKTYKAVFLYSARWKYPLYLLFYNNECIKIRGF